VLAGGADNKLYILDESLAVQSSIDLTSCPRAVDILGDKIIVGMRDGTIMELTGNGASKKTVMESHSDGELWGLDVVTNNPNFFVTSGDDNKLKVWDCTQRKCTNTTTLEAKAGPERKSGQGASTMARNSPNQ
jgi:WD40 repeat protein